MEGSDVVVVATYRDVLCQGPIRGVVVSVPRCRCRLTFSRGSRRWSRPRSQLTPEPPDSARGLLVTLTQVFHPPPEHRLLFVHLLDTMPDYSLACSSLPRQQPYFQDQSVFPHPCLQTVHFLEKSRNGVATRNRPLLSGHGAWRPISQTRTAFATVSPWDVLTLQQFCHIEFDDTLQLNVHPNSDDYFSLSKPSCSCSRNARYFLSVFHESLVTRYLLKPILTSALLLKSVVPGGVFSQE
ncbi:hypothetical protein H4582DRAFT_440472 [Lactarius indigo]|nr:hypothetical protein H4582DRAFT_440472 [Lactarius indigo]